MSSIPSFISDSECLILDNFKEKISTEIKEETLNLSPSENLPLPKESKNQKNTNSIQNFWLKNEEISQNSNTTKESNKYQGIRWGKKEDKELFKKIRDFEKEGILTLDELIRIDPDYEAEQNK